MSDEQNSLDIIATRYKLFSDEVGL